MRRLTGEVLCTAYRAVKIKLIQFDGFEKETIKKRDWESMQILSIFLTKSCSTDVNVS